LNTIPHRSQFRYWPKWKHWGRDEREAKTKFETGQRKWARNTQASFENIQKMYSDHPDYNSNGWPSIHKRKQYEAAMRILVTEKLNR